MLQNDLDLFTIRNLWFTKKIYTFQLIKNRVNHCARFG